MGGVRSRREVQFHPAMPTGNQSASLWAVEMGIVYHLVKQGEMSANAFISYSTVWKEIE